MCLAAGSGRSPAAAPPLASNGSSSRQLYSVNTMASSRVGFPEGLAGQRGGKDP